MKKDLAMVRFDCWPSLLLLCLAALIASLVDAGKIDARFDIVAVLTHDRQNEKLTHMKSAFKTLPAPIELGPGKGRLAVVSGALTTKDAPTKFEPDAKVLMNLSTDLELYERTVENFESLTNEKYSPHWGRTIDVIRTQIFTNARRFGDRGYAVVLIMSSLGEDVQGGISKAKELRDAIGAWLYIVTKNKTDMAEIAVEMAGAPTPVSRHTKTVLLINEAEFDTGLVSAMESVKKAIINHTCYWAIDCMLADKERKNCVTEPWRAYMNKEQDECIIAHRPAMDCISYDNCMAACEDRWPWEQQPCKEKCGGTDGKRRGTHPPKMENCPQWITCPPCPTITTADSGVTSHGPSAEEKTIQETGSSSMVIIIAVVVPIIVLAIVIAVVAFFVTKRAREKKRQSAAKAAAMKVAVPKVAAPSPVKKGPTGKEATVGTVAHGEAETSVAADLSVVARSKAQSVTSMLAGKTANGAAKSTCENGKHCLEVEIVVQFNERSMPGYKQAIGHRGSQHPPWQLENVIAATNEKYPSNLIWGFELSKTIPNSCVQFIVAGIPLLAKFDILRDGHCWFNPVDIGPVLETITNVLNELEKK